MSVKYQFAIPKFQAIAENLRKNLFYVLPHPVYAYYCVLFGSRVGVIVRARIRFSVWLISG